jgi:hypothetical protein
MLKQSICCRIWRSCNGMSALLLPAAVPTVQLELLLLLLLLVQVEKPLVWGLLLLHVAVLLRMQQLRLRLRRCWHLKWSSFERWAWRSLLDSTAYPDKCRAACRSCIV